MASADHVHDYCRMDGAVLCRVCFRNPAQAKLLDIIARDGSLRLAGVRLA